MSKKSVRQAAKAAVQKKIDECKNMTVDEMFSELESTLSDVILHIRMDVLDRGFTDGYKLSTMNTILHAIYRREEMEFKAKDDKEIKISYELEIPEKQHVAQA